MKESVEKGWLGQNPKPIRCWLLQNLRALPNDREEVQHDHLMLISRGCFLLNPSDSFQLSNGMPQAQVGEKHSVIFVKSSWIYETTNDVEGGGRVPRFSLSVPLGVPGEGLHSTAYGGAILVIRLRLLLIRKRSSTLIAVWSYRTPQ